MRGEFSATRAAASILLAALIGSPAAAQDAAQRRFTQNPTDPSRAEREIYVPLAMKATGSRPPSQPYTVAAATWYQQRPGARDVRPDRRLDKGEYTLEQMELTNDRGSQ